MRTDKLFYWLSNLLDPLFLEVSGIVLAKDVGYEFKSLDLKEVRQMIDGVFLPSSQTAPVYIVEYYFYKQGKAYQNILHKYVLFDQQYSGYSDIRMVVVFGDRGYDPGVLEWMKVDTPSFKIVYLRERVMNDPRLWVPGLFGVLYSESNLDRDVSSIRGAVDLASATEGAERLKLIRGMGFVFLLQKYQNINYQTLSSMLGRPDLIEELSESQGFREVMNIFNEKARHEAREEGVIQQKWAMATTMLEDGESLERISRYTGLSIEELKEGRPGQK